MSLKLACLVALCMPMFGAPHQDGADEVRVDGWSAVELWANDVLSARLRFKPSASLADKNWLALELENHTQKPLELHQTHLVLSFTIKESSSGNELATSGLSGAFPSVKSLPPGRHRFFGDALEYASANMGLPPETGWKVEAQAKLETEPNRFETPKSDPSFVFAWRYPSADKMNGMVQEMKQYLATHDDLKRHLPRMTALFKLPQVRDGLTLDDYLPALKATQDYNTRCQIVPIVFEKYANEPELLAYYREAFQNEPDVVYSDALSANVWNEAFLEPLVSGCENGKWKYFDVLSRHSLKWRNSPSHVNRVSAALLKQHPILKREVQTIPEKELEQWAEAVGQAADVADPALVDLLTPALNDKRSAHINLGAGGWEEGRVCDRALTAILQILDGDSWAAFEQAGIQGWSTDEERLKVHDQVIEILTERLNSRQSSKDEK